MVDNTTRIKLWMLNAIGWLRSQGYEVLRFWNDEVLTKIDGVKEVIFQTLNMPPPLSSPDSGEE